MSKGEGRLVLYADEKCTKPLEQTETGAPFDLGETLLDGSTKTIQLYLRNVGNRTVHMLEFTVQPKRADIEIHFPDENIPPGAVSPIRMLWHTDKAVDNLKLEMRWRLKYFPFGD
jgi:hypothetical protein